MVSAQCRRPIAEQADDVRRHWSEPSVAAVVRLGANLGLLILTCFASSPSIGAAIRSSHMKSVT